MHTGNQPTAADPHVPNPHRLARTVTPARYDLTISPDLPSRSFVGRVTVTLDVHEPLATLVCNAAEITVHQAWVVDASGTRTNSISIKHDELDKRLSLDFERTVAPGLVKLTMEYEGTLNDKLAGFYASTYTDDAGVLHTIATTQLQSTDARKAFPCWDEPDFKAVFSVTLVVAAGLTAISNEPVKHETVMASGKRAITFEDTMVMSTYLLCFIVGELEMTAPVDVDGVPLRVVHRPGMAHLTAFALEIGAFALRYFRDYYGIAYPGRKMDLIALPDFAAGAMENVGAVTFREMLLLVDPAQASHLELERIADVVAHEIAHMWFGDLVTMSWWNGIWLNEAFATYAEVACVAAFRPEWDRWTSFGVSRSAAMQIDALHNTRPIEFPVLSPTDAEGMFDLLTYEKGASILRQLEQYLGEDVFREGVRRYLGENSYGNTETIDLFDALESVSSQPVAEMMNGWIFTGGFPLVSAAAAPGGVTLTQQPFTYLPDGPATSWLVPVLWRTPDGDSAEALGKSLLAPTSGPVSIQSGDAPVIINAGGHGFYRVHYDETLAARIRQVFATLPAIERFGIVNDAWASVLAGSGASSYIQLIRTLTTERDPNVWTAVVAGLGALNQIADEEALPKLQQFVRTVCGPAMAELGWEPLPGESSKQAQLRGIMILALGGLGADPATRSESAAFIDRAIAGQLAPDVAAAIINVAARQGDASLWERYDHARQSGSPLDAIRYLRALVGFEDPVLRQRTIDLAFSDRVRSQDSPFMIIPMLADRVNGPFAWAALQSKWDTYTATIPTNAVGRMLDGIVQRTEPGLVEEITAFFAAHPIPQAAKQVSQKLELLRVHQGLRDREAAGLAAALRLPLEG